MGGDEGGPESDTGRGEEGLSNHGYIKVKLS